MRKWLPLVLFVLFAGNSWAQTASFTVVSAPCNNNAGSNFFNKNLMALMLNHIQFLIKLRLFVKAVDILTSEKNYE